MECTLAPPGEFRWTVHVCRRYGLFVKLLWLLVSPQAVKISGVKQKTKTEWTRMWANAQCDGRPAEYTWRRLFNAPKFGWRPLLECRAVTLQRRETRWNLLGCPKLANRSRSLVGRSSPYCEEIWGILLFDNFFPIVITCLSCEDIARQSCAMVPRWRFFASCISSQPRAARFRPAS